MNFSLSNRTTLLKGENILKMYLVSQVQMLDKAFCTNTTGKGTNSTILPLSIGT